MSAEGFEAIEGIALFMEIISVETKEELLLVEKFLNHFGDSIFKIDANEKFLTEFQPCYLIRDDEDRLWSISTSEDYEGSGFQANQIESFLKSLEKNLKSTKQELETIISDISNAFSKGETISESSITRYNKLLRLLKKTNYGK